MFTLKKTQIVKKKTLKIKLLQNSNSNKTKKKTLEATKLKNSNWDKL